MTCARGLSAALAVRYVGLPSYYSCLCSESERVSHDRRYSPLRVKRVISTVRRPLPIYPDKQTFSVSVGMSQRCQLRKYVP
jgi:hypothetical protein